MLDRDVSGRDLKIISEALYIAIPFMLKHTMSASNTRDMIRIMEYIDKDFGFFSHLKRQELMRADIKGKTKILELDEDIANKKTLSHELQDEQGTKNNYMANEIKTYLDKIEEIKSTIKRY